MSLPRPGTSPAAARTGRTGFRRAFSAFSYRDYRFYFGSAFASQLSMQMGMIAQGILVWNLTGSFTITGVLSLSWGIPMISLSLVGGATADRFQKRSLVLVAQLTGATTSVITGVLIATGLITVPLLFLLGFVQGTTFAFMMPARQALLRELVPDRELMNAVALNSGARSATTILGPAVAGVIVGLRDVQTAYFLLATVNFTAFLSFSRIEAGRTVSDGGGAGAGPFRDVWAGLQYVAVSPVLRTLLLMAALPAFFGMPYQMLLPGFASEELGRQSAYATMLTIAGVGALAGSMMIATLSSYERKPLLQLIVGLGLAGSLVGLGLGSKSFGYSAALIASVAIGFSLNTFQALNNTMILAAADPKYTGRVMSIVMFTFSAMPFMSAPLGLLADWIGASTVFALMGSAVAILLAAMLLFNRKHLLGATPSVVRAPEQQLAREGKSGAPAAGA